MPAFHLLSYSSIHKPLIRGEGQHSASPRSAATACTAHRIISYLNADARREIHSGISRTSLRLPLPGERTLLAKQATAHWRPPLPHQHTGRLNARLNGGLAAISRVPSPALLTMAGGHRRVYVVRAHYRLRHLLCRFMKSTTSAVTGYRLSLLSVCIIEPRAYSTIISQPPHGFRMTHWFIGRTTYFPAISRRAITKAGRHAENRLRRAFMLLLSRAGDVRTLATLTFCNLAVSTTYATWAAHGGQHRTSFVTVTRSAVRFYDS